MGVVIASHLAGAGAPSLRVRRRDVRDSGSELLQIEELVEAEALDPEAVIGGFGG